MKTNKLGFALVLTFILAGCGGGGGKNNVATTTPTPATPDTDMSRTGGNSVTHILSAASAGSITSGPVEVEVTSENGQLVHVVTGIDGRITIAGSVDTPGGVNFAADTVMDGNGQRTVFLATDYDTTTGTPDTDYLAGGTWIYIPSDGTGASELGAFADGNDPFIQGSLMAVTGTATYEGSATGIYKDPDGSSGNGLFSGFSSEASLRSDFGTSSALGSISGTLRNFVDEDGRAVAGNPMVMLDSANIGATDSGFFTGDTNITFVGDTFTGKWGGQFYGNGASVTDQPGSVAGTFSGFSTTGITRGDSFLGVFGAYKQ